MARSQTLSLSHTPLLVILGAVLFYGVWYTTSKLPDALTIADEPNAPYRFIAERAQNITVRIARLGPKVVGSYQNQVLAKQFLLTEIERIRTAASPAHRIEVDVQRASGSFPIVGMTSIYANIENVVVRLSPRNLQPTNSLLLNTHFDSVPISPGGSDASFMVSVMLETLRVLATSTRTHEHSVVFLFNGAEENGLQGSHPFITQHKWAADVRCVINMDSSGSGGKETLFQLTPGFSWLMKYYQAAVPHPQTSGLQQELFQMNIIPSDTDFRIFRDYGHIAGVDLATGKNGYVYHTKYDRAETIEIESYQNVGDNVLALTRALANAAELRDLKSSVTEDRVFYDFLGYFVVTYTQTQGVLANVAVSIVVAVLVVLSLEQYARASGYSFCRIFGEFVAIFLVQVVSIVAGAALVVACAYEYDHLHHSMAWFSSPFLPIGIYMCPFFAALALGPAVYVTLTQKRVTKKTAGGEDSTAVVKTKVLKRSYQVQMFLHAQAIVLAAVMLGLTYLGYRLAYVILVTLIFYAVSLLINWTTQALISDLRWIPVHLCAQALPFAFYVAQYLGIVPGLIPVEGRAGLSANPENVIAVFTTAVALLLGGMFVPVLVFVRRPVWAASWFVAAWLLAVGFMFTSAGFPYRPVVSEQRFWIYHTDRTFHSFNETTPAVSDSGYFMLGMDRHSNEYVANIVPGVAKAINTAAFCDAHLFCGVPLYTARQIGQAPFSSWVPAGSPKIASLTKLQLLQSTNVAANIKRFSFALTGPDHTNLFLSPLAGSRVINTTLTSQLAPSPVQWHNQTTYFVLFGSANLTSAAYQFTLDVQTTVSLEQPTIEIAAVGHVNHNDDMQTSEFQTFLAAFPRWAHVTPWMSSYESWTY